MSSITTAKLLCSWEPSHTSFTAEMQEKASEGLQFPGPSCYIVEQVRTGQEAGFQVSPAFNEVSNFFFCIFPPTQIYLSFSPSWCHCISIYWRTLAYSLAYCGDFGMYTRLIAIKSIFYFCLSTLNT